MLNSTDLSHLNNVEEGGFFPLAETTRMQFPVDQYLSPNTHLSHELEVTLSSSEMLSTCFAESKEPEIILKFNFGAAFTACLTKSCQRRKCFVVAASNHLWPQ